MRAPSSPRHRARLPWRPAVLCLALGPASPCLHADTSNVCFWGCIAYQLVDTPRLASGQMQQEASVVLGGAHSRPLERRTEAGQKALWVAGDWGADHHGTGNGNLGLAEVGLGHNVGAMQANLAVGHAWSDQNSATNGDVDHMGTYLLGEALVPLQGRLWGVLSGYYQWGDAKIRRAYLSGGPAETSFGNTDTRAWAVRARLEWAEALSLGEFQLSPYGDLSSLHTHTQAYVETGGISPNVMDAHKEHVTELRLGLHGYKPLSHGLRLLGQLEGVHRFEGKSEPVSGQATSVSLAYTITGQPYKQDWLRLGVGLESRLAGGRGTLMLNLTTEGAAPNAWLAAAYRY